MLLFSKWYKGWRWKEPDTEILLHKEGFLCEVPCFHETNIATKFLTQSTVVRYILIKTSRTQGGVQGKTTYPSFGLLASRSLVPKEKRAIPPHTTLNWLGRRLFKVLGHQLEIRAWCLLSFIWGQFILNSFGGSEYSWKVKKIEILSTTLFREFTINE